MENINRIKKYFKRFLQIIIILNVFLYGIFYQRYVSTAPDTHKEARINMINALMIHNIYFLALKVGIDFQNPLLKPIVKLRDIFYKKGLNNLPENDAEKAIWFETFELIPHNLSVRGKYGNLIKNYGEEFGNKFLDDSLKYIALLAENELIDKNFKDKEHLSSCFYLLNKMFIEESKVYPEEYTYSNKNIVAFTKKKNLYEKFFFLYQKRKQFVEKYKDTKHFKSLMAKKNNFEDEYSVYHIDNMTLNTLILFYGSENKIIKDCKTAKPYFKEIFIEKDKLRKYMKELNLSANYTTAIENFFFKFKIQNTRYDSSKTGNPLRLGIRCNYDDIFIKNGN